MRIKRINTLTKKLHDLEKAKKAIKAWTPMHKKTFEATRSVWAEKNEITRCFK